MTINYFLGIFLLGFITNVVVGFLASVIAYFVFTFVMTRSYKISEKRGDLLTFLYYYDTMEDFIGGAVFITSFIFMDYIAVTRIFANYELMLESIISTLVVIAFVVIFNYASYTYSLKQKIEKSLFYIVFSTILWVFLCCGKMEGKYNVDNATPVIIEERYKITNENDTTRNEEIKQLTL